MPEPTAPAAPTPTDAPLAGLRAELSGELITPADRAIAAEGFRLPRCGGAGTKRGGVGTYGAPDASRPARDPGYVLP